MDLGDHVDTRQQESLRAPGPLKVPVPHSEVGLRHRGELEGVYETAGGGGGLGCGEVVRFEPPTTLRRLAPDEGVVSGCG